MFAPAPLGLARAVFAGVAAHRRTVDIEELGMSVLSQVLSLGPSCTDRPVCTLSCRTLTVASPRFRLERVGMPTDRSAGQDPFLAQFGVFERGSTDLPRAAGVGLCHDCAAAIGHLRG